MFEEHCYPAYDTDNLKGEGDREPFWSIFIFALTPMSFRMNISLVDTWMLTSQLNIINLDKYSKALI